MSKQEFEYAEKTTAKDLAEYFIKLAEGFRSNGLELRGKGQTIALKPEDSVKLEVKASCQEDEGELELEIFWKKDVSSTAERLQVNPGISEQNEPS